MHTKKLLILIYAITISSIVFGMDEQMMDNNKLKAMQNQLAKNLKFQVSPPSTYTADQDKALEEQEKKAPTIANSASEPQNAPSPLPSSSPQNFSDELQQKLHKRNAAPQKPVSQAPVSPTPAPQISPVLAKIQLQLSDKGRRPFNTALNIFCLKNIITTDELNEIQDKSQQNFNDGRNHLFALLKTKTLQSESVETALLEIQATELLEKQKKDAQPSSPQNSPSSTKPAPSQGSVIDEYKKKKNIQPKAPDTPPVQKKSLPHTPQKPHPTATQDRYAHSKQKIQTTALSLLKNNYFIYGTPTLIGIMYVGYRISKYLKHRNSARKNTLTTAIPASIATVDQMPALAIDHRN